MVGQRQGFRPGRSQRAQKLQTASLHLHASERAIPSAPQRMLSEPALWKAAMQACPSISAADALMSTPIRRIRSPCCARAECGQQLPSSDSDCHTPLPREVRKARYHVTSVQSLRSKTVRVPLSTGPHPWRVGELATAPELSQRPDKLQKRLFRIRRLQAGCMRVLLGGAIVQE